MISPLVEGHNVVQLFLDLRLDVSLPTPVLASTTFLMLMFVTGWSAWQSKATESKEDEIWREELRRRITGDSGDDAMNDEESTDLAIKPVTDSIHEKTIIANGLVFEGELEAHEDILVLGRVEGKIDSAGHEVRIAQEAHVDGEILAHRLVIEGAVSGTATAGEKVILEEAAEVSGEINTSRLVLGEGCKFNGQVRMD